MSRFAGWKKAEETDEDSAVQCGAEFCWLKADLSSSAGSCRPVCYGMVWYRFVSCRIVVSCRVVSCVVLFCIVLSGKCLGSYRYVLRRPIDVEFVTELCKLQDLLSLSSAQDHKYSVIRPVCSDCAARLDDGGNT